MGKAVLFAHISMMLLYFIRAEKLETNITLSWTTNSSIEINLEKTVLNITLTITSNIPGINTPCLFKGEVEGEPEAVVAVSGCHNSSETLVTIASSQVPGSILDLSLVDGITYHVGFDNDSVTIPNGGRMKRQLPLPPPNDALTPRPDPLQGSIPPFTGELPSKVVLKTDIKYDNSLLEHFKYSHKKTKQWLDAVVNHARPRMAFKSLIMKVDIKIGAVDHIDETIIPHERRAEKLIRDHKLPSLTSYFCKKLCDSRCLKFEVKGVGYTGGACKENGDAVSISSLYTTTQSEISTGRVFAHEVGHLIGMNHDHHPKYGFIKSKCYGKGIMSDGEFLKLEKWSDCSNSDFENWWRGEGYRCVKEAKGTDDYCGPYNRGEHYLVTTTDGNSYLVQC